MVDGNVIRIFSRVCDLDADVTQTATQKQIWQIAEDALPDARVGNYNQALMDLGRLICKPRTPLCAECPVSQHCCAYQRGTQTERPVKPAKAKTPHYDVTAGIIWNARGEVLIAQRPLDGLLGGLWEFPGGKQEAGESLPECLQRELREELAIEVEVGDLFTTVKHGFTHFKITLHAFRVPLCKRRAAEARRPRFRMGHAGSVRRLRLRQGGSAGDRGAARSRRDAAVAPSIIVGAHCGATPTGDTQVRPYAFGQPCSIPESYI